MSALAICPLSDLGILRVRGPDARKFLQGQLSNDLSSLRPGALLRAGLHNPQGRTLALLALSAAASSDEIRAILPRELLGAVAATLARYVLRSKVQIIDDSGSHQIYGITSDAVSLAELASAGTAAELLHGYAPQRALLVTDSAQSAPAPAAMTRAEWRALDIAAGLPQVYPPTSGQFVAQMLNLDCIGAVSFTKGCYTGQEVIARAHYRGRVKRRMQRFISEASLQLAAGDAGMLADGRSFRVVDAVDRADGRCEFLAVAELPTAAPAVEGDAQAAGASVASEGRRIVAHALALPYPLPE